MAGAAVGRLKISKINEAPTIKRELLDFEVSQTETGRMTFGARSNAHDDLVLATALGLWRASYDPYAWMQMLGPDHLEWARGRGLSRQECDYANAIKPDRY